MVILGGDGCRENNPGCSAAIAMIVFEGLWVLTELIAICCTLWIYRRLFQLESRKGRNRFWIRGFQVLTICPHKHPFRSLLVQNLLTSFCGRLSWLAHLLWFYCFRSYPRPEYRCQKAFTQVYVMGCWFLDAVSLAFCVSGILS